MLIERRSGRRLMNQINVVPYIDVMLVLLVIFMVTAPMVNPGMIELPSIGKSSQPPIAPLEVAIHADESLWLRDRDKTADETKVTRDQVLAGVLRGLSRHRQRRVARRLGLDRRRCFRLSLA